MDDATFEAQKARVERLVEPWRKNLGMGYLRDFRLRWHRDGEALREGGHPGALAVTSVYWAYKDVVIEWDLSLVAEMRDEGLEYAVVHEFMHVFVQQVVTVFADSPEITGVQSEHVERTATDLAQAMMWVRDAALDGSLPPGPSDPEAETPPTPVFLDAVEGGP